VILRSGAGRCIGAFLGVGALAFVGLSGSAGAQSNLPVPRYDEGAAVEAEVVLPAYPQPGDLIRFPTSWTTHEISVDRRSLVSEPDGLVRYTLVVRSSGGAENVSHEGLRCYSGERRVYAWGRREVGGGTWAPARNANWAPINDRGINRYYYEFWRDVFCDGKISEPRNVILDNLQRGGRGRAQGNPSD
jgi:hypothetical protein